MKKIIFSSAAFIALFMLVCFSCPANAGEFKVAVSLKDNDFFLEPAKHACSKLIVSNIGTVDAQIFVSAEIEKDAPFELIVDSNPTYVYANGIYDSYFLIGSDSYGAKEIKFSFLVPYKKIKKEHKKTYKIKLNVFASPILIFGNEDAIRSNVRHQYQYEIKVDLSDNFTYLRDKKMSFYMENQESQKENIKENENNEINNEINNFSISTGNENETLYFGGKDEEEKNTSEEQKPFPFITIIIIVLGILGIILALKY